MNTTEPILKEHKLIFLTPLKHHNDNSWVFSAICDDCKRVMNMKFHWLDVDKQGVKGFSALWERAVRLTFEDSVCEVYQEPEPLKPELPKALKLTEEELGELE